MNIADKATEQFSLATAPGGFLVDLIPACTMVSIIILHKAYSRTLVRHLPCSFPGAGFQLTAREWSSTLLEMVEAPYNFVKEQVVSDWLLSSIDRVFTTNSGYGYCSCLLLFDSIGGQST